MAGPPASQPARPLSLLTIFHQISKRGLGGKSGRLSFPRTNRGCDAPSIGPTMSEDSNQTLITAGSHACCREGGGTHSWVSTPASFFPSLLSPTLPAAPFHPGLPACRPAPNWYLPSDESERVHETRGCHHPLTPVCLLRPESRSSFVSSLNHVCCGL